MLTKEEVAQIAQKDDFHIAPYRADGTTVGTFTWIWSVAVNSDLFVRAHNGKALRWYQAAIKQKAGKIQAAGLEKEVQFETVRDSRNEAIDKAYREKYSSSPYLKSMISDRARAATIRVY